MKTISYSLFGDGSERPKNCFEFETYLRGLMINVRMDRLLYPDWYIHLALDEATYQGEYKPLFDALSVLAIKVSIHPNDKPLCEKMLWRMFPVFIKDGHGTKINSHVICRDLDSVATYREVQAVEEWIAEDKTIHCITDSISHTIPMLGGMIGVIPRYLTERIGVNDWKDFQKLYTGFNMHKKGADQDFLNRIVYPKCADSATEHFVKGMIWNLAEGNGRHYRIDEGYPTTLHPDLKQSNQVCGHIGSAGYYEMELMRFLNQFDVHKEDYQKLESQYSEVFHWARGK